MDNSQLKDLLELKYQQYNQVSFIESDPIQIPHNFNIPEDIEISGFLAATIAWGQRKSIINNARRLMQLMGNSPYDFVMEASDDQFERLLGFKHRTFQGEDCYYFLHSLRNIYSNHGGLRKVFEQSYHTYGNIEGTLNEIRNIFFELPGLKRTRKHVSDVASGSSAKRLNMFLRWMVRKDDKGVDFGIWQGIPSSALYLPLDVHTGNVGRKLGLLTRKQNDWKAVEEITARLQDFDPADPVKYDFALFGLGVFEKF
jgi:uncharacterized protein (TIGR02757 family)